MTLDSDSKLESKQTLSPEPAKHNQQQEKKQEIISKKKQQPEQKNESMDDVKQFEINQNGIEERHEPEGRQTDTTVTEEKRKEVGMFIKSFKKEYLLSSVFWLFPP